MDMDFDFTGPAPEPQAQPTINQPPQNNSNLNGDLFAFDEPVNTGTNATSNPPVVQASNTNDLLLDMPMNTNNNNGMMQNNIGMMGNSNNGMMQNNIGMMGNSNNGMMQNNMRGNNGMMQNNMGMMGNNNNGMMNMNMRGNNGMMQNNMGLNVNTLTNLGPNQPISKENGSPFGINAATHNVTYNAPPSIQANVSKLPSGKADPFDFINDFL
jgi:hypothetical protein